MSWTSALECKRRNTLLVVDECFMEFLPEWNLYSLKNEVISYSNLVVIDAFTKTYSLAGFRLGFCLAGSMEILSAMKKWGQSFSVSAPAQFAGVCALHDQEYMQTTYQFLPAEREWLFHYTGKTSGKESQSQGLFAFLRFRQRVLPDCNTNP